MRVAVAGSSGLIGTALVESLRADGHEVLRLVRRSQGAPSESPWDPTRGLVERDRLTGVAAIVNLAGAGVGDHRWTDAYKAEIRRSRVDSTRTLAQAAADLSIPVLVNASAIGFYGDTGSTAVDESAAPGTGFLADVVVDWEQATAPARAAGVRVVLARTGLVMSRRGGAWQRMLPLFRLGLGGRMGSGKQFWSFVSITDQVAALRFALERHEVNGPINITAPHPATNREVTAALARELHRPAVLPVPAAALRVVLGEFATEVLGSARVLPTALTAAGFVFQHPDIDTATKALVTS